MTDFLRSRLPRDAAVGKADEDVIDTIRELGVLLSLAEIRLSIDLLPFVLDRNVTKIPRRKKVAAMLRAKDDPRAAGVLGVARRVRRARKPSVGGAVRSR